jgi:hypothetical protein
MAPAHDGGRDARVVLVAGTSVVLVLVVAPGDVELVDDVDVLDDVEELVLDDVLVDEEVVVVGAFDGVALAWTEFGPSPPAFGPAVNCEATT